jgi:hypothetical protein
MTVIKVFTDDGQEVAVKKVDDTWSDQAIARHVVGNLHTILGWLGRAIDDARVMQAGGDPERPSEKAMRLAAEQRREKRRQQVHMNLDDDKPVA